MKEDKISRIVKKAEACATKKRRGRPRKKVATVEQAQAFVLAYGETMTNSEMAIALNIPRRRVAGTIAALKRAKTVLKGYFLSDKQKEQKKVGRGRGRRKAEKKRYDMDWDGTKKMTARKFVINKIIESMITVGNFLSLPAAQCRFELMMNRTIQYNKFSLDFCEMDSKTHKELLQTIVRTGLNVRTIHKGMLGEIISKAGEGEYSHIFADYCCHPSSIVGDLIMAMRNKVVGIGGYIFVTFALRSSNKSFVREFYRGEPTSKHNSETVIAFRNFVKQFPDFEINDEFHYADKSKNNPVYDGAKMVVVAIKRVK